MNGKLKTSLSCYYQNIGGMKSSLQNFKNLVLQSSYDVIILTETWLSDDISLIESSIQGYSIFRCDRSTYASEKKGGGGVLLAIKINLNPKLIKTNVRLEQCCVEIVHGTSKIIIGGIYLPPNSTVDKYSLHAEEVEKLMQSYINHNSFIAGDYHLPQAAWSNGNLGVTVQCPISSPAFTLCETFSFLNLYQHNYVHNSRNILLDLIFSNLESVSVLPAIDLHNSIHHTSMS
ncbi:hypothetical protein JTB14_031069 [Gonioctena quinquepunctata]|nr:hypothetical protein JTB14_031069 [Gonioctena quinquepunctata]